MTMTTTVTFRCECDHADCQEPCELERGEFDKAKAVGQIVLSNHCPFGPATDDELVGAVGECAIYVPGPSHWTGPARLRL